MVAIRLFFNLRIVVACVTLTSKSAPHGVQGESIQAILGTLHQLGDQHARGIRCGSVWVVVVVLCHQVCLVCWLLHCRGCFCKLVQVGNRLCTAASSHAVSSCFLACRLACFSFRSC
ncbi:hypothetical protein BCR44DRAFT_1441897 [Catenaria anguillulae PL171]|uniref:Secreted protein n=1 Tax=Catenaria anguillulae PL171 TaxID=765915 RepID=A0A1Y2HAV7_9FUNG|nr:hypothetical protein BCR44DRAFT_1441897 [Catenaria anguillulae PL171]